MKAIVPGSAQRLGVMVLVLLVGSCLGLFAYAVARQREQALDAALATAQTHARNFEEHLTQTLLVTELVMGSVEPGGGALNAADYAAAARTALRPAPYLRSLSLLDEAGRIVASSTAANLGTRPDLHDVFPAGQPDAQVLRLGVPQSGRDVGQARPLPPGSEPGPAPGVIPALRRVEVRTGARPLRSLAAINPDHFVHHFTQLLDPQAGRVQWLRHDGTLLVSSHPADVPGATGAAGAVGAQLARRDAGRFEQTLPDGTAVLTAYRASSRFPALIVVHLDLEHVLGGWRDESQRMALVVLPAVAALAFVGLLALRWQAQTDRQRGELQRQMQLSASVFDASSEAIALTAPDGRIISCNPAFLSMTGYEARQVLGHTHGLFSSGRQSSEFYRHMWDHILRDGHWEGELTNRRADGSLYHALVSINAVRDEHDRLQHYVSVTRDITELRRAEAARREAELQRQQQAAERQRLLELAVRDPLTGLFNRRYLDETLPRELARVKREQHPLAVVLVDIDRFKSINDQHGHAAGDEAIRALARVLGHGAREGDIVCRHGGEEFVVVMPGMDTASALARAEQWRQQAAALVVRHGGHDIRFTLSAGVAIWPVHGTDAQALLHGADMAMYEAKAAGRDRVVEAVPPGPQRRDTSQSATACGMAITSAG